MTQPGGPLAGIRVLDLSRAFGGPLVAMALGELGAAVVKLEHPAGGDETRAWPPILADGRSTYVAALNRNKRSLTLDLKHPRAHDVVCGLAAWADVLVENFTPGVAERLGIDYATLEPVNLGLVYCSISGFGQDGPYRERRGYDPILQAMGGLMGLTGERGGGPLKTMLPAADLLTASFSTVAVIAALYHRERTGEGQYIDMSMLDVMVASLTTVGTAYLQTGVVPVRSGTQNPARVPSAAFECSDGAYVQLVPNQRQWPRFCDVIGAPELADDERFADPVSRVDHQDELYARLRDLLRARPAAEWVDVFADAGIPAGPIHTLDTLFDDPQVRARELVGELDGMRVIELPFRFSRTAAAMQSPPPALGEHTDEVLREVLGYSDETIEELHASRAV